MTPIYMEFKLGNWRSQIPIAGMDIAVSKRRRNFSSKFIAAAGLITLCIVMFKQSHDSSSLKQG
ncbi:hypothetical protein DVH24_027948 [Malus domestica]|uniref:Uncharacterized protein n=1 Tax=Malus domestica TaxID=3750 RepID=A0A498HF96_MALDO|nr:hypothetical protein DVH24_027948 [Malus domestica]